MKRLMIIDDDKEFLEEISHALGVCGYEICALYDSTNAAAKASEFMPDLIFLDLKMDKKSGFRIADELTVNPKTKNIPVIAITGVFTRQEYKLLMTICNIRDCLIKPIEVSDMIHSIEKIHKY